MDKTPSPAPATEKCACGCHGFPYKNKPHCECCAAGRGDHTGLVPAPPVGAWACSLCGQHNAEWATDCGRCGRPESTPKPVGADENCIADMAPLPPQRINPVGREGSERRWQADFQCRELYEVGDDTSGRRCVTAQSMILPGTPDPHPMVEVVSAAALDAALREREEREKHWHRLYGEAPFMRAEELAMEIADLQRRLDEAVGLLDRMHDFGCGSCEHGKDDEGVHAFLAANRKP